MYLTLKQRVKHFSKKEFRNLKYLCHIAKNLKNQAIKASFFDGDEIPIYDKENQKEYIFSGKRIKRGLYQTSKGYKLNADCNGALNILRKSKVVDLSILYNRGELNTPKRIRVV